MSQYPKNYFREKAIRDPLYGFIDLSQKETQVIDSEIFRRLQFIKQLSHAYVVYPTAVHTRFEHSLGTVYVANKMAEELELSDSDKEIVRLSTLLHDVGHGPFSHLFEQIIGKINPNQLEPHEKISRIMINEDPELDSCLGSKKNQIIELLKKEFDPMIEPTKSLHSDIISSGLDADKLDYLRRDSYHIGVAYGQFDLDRILHTLSTTTKGSKIIIDSKGKDAVENYRLGRYLMHAQVYEHHARLVADNMFLKALDIAINQENVLDKDLLKFDPAKENTEFLKFYKSLDDYSIYQKIIDSDKSKISKDILINIKRRKLLKRSCEFTPNDLGENEDVNTELMKMKPEKFEEISNEIADSLSLQHHEMIFHKSQIKIKLYSKGEILFRHKDKILDLEGVSPISAKDSVIKYYVFGPSDKSIREKIAKKIADRLGVEPNKISYLF